MKLRILIVIIFLVVTSVVVHQQFVSEAPSDAVILQDPVPDQKLSTSGTAAVSETDHAGQMPLQTAQVLPEGLKNLVPQVNEPLPKKPFLFHRPQISEEDETKRKSRRVFDAEEIALWKLEGQLTAFARESNLDGPLEEDRPNYLPRRAISSAFGLEQIAESSSASE